MSDEIAEIAEHFTRSWYGEITKLARAYQAQSAQLTAAESRALQAVAREEKLRAGLETACRGWNGWTTCVGQLVEKYGNDEIKSLWDGCTLNAIEALIERERGDANAVTRLLAKEKTRVVEAVAREAELVGALRPFANLLPDNVVAVDSLQQQLQRWSHNARAALSSTSPRAKQLLAIVAAARELKANVSVGAGRKAHRYSIYVADDLWVKFVAALTTHPTDEENSR